jgi:two-component system sensor histidine kinase/response regulator
MATATSVRKRILVVAEDTTTRNLLRRQLQEVEFDVAVATHLADLIERLPEYAPDVMLVTMSENRVQLLHICEKLKASPTYRHIPIVLLAPSGDAVAGDTLAAKVDEILVGSITQAELLARVRSMVRIRQQYDELERTIEMRMALSYMIVHDVRNPLAAISLYMQLLKRKAQLQPDQIKYLDLALGEAQKMSSFLDDMLMLSKMERGRLSLSHSPLSLDRVCASVVEKLTPLAETQGVRLKINHSPQTQPIMADVTLFQRMLENLIAVALKRSPVDSVVALSVSYPRTMQANGEVQAQALPMLKLSVSDQGEPIPVEDLERIFDQLEAVRLKERGRSDLGLELAFCRMVVDAHGGRIFAVNSQDVGVAFVVELM